jgi:hypothetical protein
MAIWLNFSFPEVIEEGYSGSQLSKVQSDS